MCASGLALKSVRFMRKSLIALAFGTLGLGIAEFVMMGILPKVAQGMGVDIPAAGHLISAYALGVSVGAPMLIFVRRFRLKHILVALALLMVVGNLCAAAAPGYWWLIAARFVSGLPHGAYFGVASIVAEKLAGRAHGSEAVSIMIAGMTVANLFGVPLGTSLADLLSWRVTFLLVGAWGLLVCYYLCRWVPHVEGVEDTGLRGQFRFLSTAAPWLVLGATMLGNGGVFCWYSYVSPMLVEVAGFSTGSVTALMMLAGFGMVVGNLASGRMSDRYSPGLVGTCVQAGLCVVLLLIFFFAPCRWALALLMALCTAGLFAVSSPEQVLMIRVSPGGQMLGAACVQVAFNMGNALGAYVGGVASVHGYQYTALSGAGFAFIGFLLFVVWLRRYQSRD